MVGLLQCLGEWLGALYTMAISIIIVAGKNINPPRFPTDIPHYVAMYNHIADTWQFLPNITANARISTTALTPAVYVRNGKLYAFDGNGLANCCISKYRILYSLTLNNTNEGWNVKSGLPFDLQSGSPLTTVDVGNLVYTTGVSLGVPSHQTAIASWDPSRDELSWEVVMHMNIGRSAGHCAVSDGEATIWVLGGCGNCWGDGFMEQCDVDSKQCIKKNALPNILLEEKSTLKLHICE